MGTRTLSILLVSLAMVSVLLGCGSDGSTTSGAADGSSSTASSSSSSKPAGPLTPAQFAAAATKLCDEARQKYTAEAPEAFLKLQANAKGATPQDLEAKVIQTVLADSLQEKVDDVRALGIPKGDEKQVETILTAIEEVAEKARTEPRKFIYQQANFKHPFFKARHLADEYDIGHCARA